MLNKLKNIIKRGCITLDRKDSFGQCSSMGVPSNYQALYPYGMYAIPKQSNNPLVVLLSILADESNKAAIENDPTTYPSGLDIGDVIIYNPDSSAQLRLGVDGKIAIGVGTTELLQQISELLSESIDDATAASNHFHTGAGAGNPTSVPNNTADFIAVAANLTAIKVLIDALKGTIV